MNFAGAGEHFTRCHAIFMLYNTYIKIHVSQLFNNTVAANRKMSDYFCFILQDKNFFRFPFLCLNTSYIISESKGETYKKEGRKT